MTTDLPEIPETSCLRRYSDDPAWTEAHIRAPGLACWNAAIEAAAKKSERTIWDHIVCEHYPIGVTTAIAKAIRALTKGE